MRHFVFRWIATTIAVFVAAPIVGINYGDRLGCLLGASLLLGIINAFIRPVLLLLSLPLILVTLGLFILIINALMLKFVGEIMPCFEVPGFWRAFFGAIIISIVSWLLSAFFRGSDGHVHVLTHHSQIRSGPWPGDRALIFPVEESDRFPDRKNELSRRPSKSEKITILTKVLAQSRPQFCARAKENAFYSRN